MSLVMLMLAKAAGRTHLQVSSPVTTLSSSTAHAMLQPVLLCRMQHLSTCQHGAVVQQHDQALNQAEKSQVRHQGLKEPKESRKDTQDSRNTFNQQLLAHCTQIGACHAAGHFIANPGSKIGMNASHHPCPVLHPDCLTFIWVLCRAATSGIQL